MRRPLVLLVASAAAIVGFVILATVIVGIGTHTLQASHAGTSPCLQAYADDLEGSHVRYTIFPPRGVCTWVVDGRSREVVVASSPSALVATGTVLALGGALVCVAVLVGPRLRRSRG